MTNTIFDLVQEDIPEGQEGYFAVAKNAPEPKDDSFFNSISDYAKTFLKGTAEGLGRLGRVMGPLQNYEGLTTEQELEKQTDNLDIALPTDEGFGQKALRRGLRQAPTMAAFPGAGAQSLARSGLAGTAGQTAEALGAPEWLQTISELTAYIGPDITKKLLETGNNKSLIAAARKFGLSDEAITPLIQSEAKQKWLTKLAPKRGKTQEALARTHGELKGSYSNLAKSDAAKHTISEEVASDAVDSIKNILKETPSSIREKILPDFQDLLSSPRNSESLINFWVDINAAGKEQLGRLKDPILKAVESVSPELAKDFKNVNMLYGKYYPISKRLQPTVMSDIIGASKSLGVLMSVFGGVYPAMIHLATPFVASKLAQKMLTSPRFQQLSHKMINAVDQNKFSIFEKTARLLSKEIGKVDEETGKELKDISKEDLMKLYGAIQQSTEK